jgi:hypothetical protein
MGIKMWKKRVGDNEMEGLKGSTGKDFHILTTVLK